MFPPETRVLFVDDMQSIRDLIRDQLRTLGYKNIFEATNGEEALEILKQRQAIDAPIQLVISDWSMPKMLGIDLLKHVRSQPEWKDLPFVLLTSEAQREQVSEAVLAGVSQYIVKPFAPKSFQEKLKSAWLKHNKA